MNKIFLITLTAFGLFVSSSVLAKIDYYIDPDILKYETLRKQKMADLSKEYNCDMKTNFACLDKIYDEVSMEYPPRGRDYAKMHYTNFTEAQAYAKLAELAKLYEKLPLKVAGKPPLGVIKKSAIEQEAWYLAKDVLQIHKKRSSDLMVKYNDHFLRQPFLDKKLNILTPLVK